MPDADEEYLAVSDDQTKTWVEVEEEEEEEEKTDESRQPSGSMRPLQQTPSSMSIRFQKGDSTKMKSTSVYWMKLCKTVHDESQKDNKKTILENVSGHALPGEMVALMGPSGSGKTTLLNVLGGRALQDMEGVVYLNGVPSSKTARRTVAYVLQEDIFHMQLTVRQQLWFTANLRLPDDVGLDMKKKIVDHVLATLRLEKCMDTKILLVSGGEKKRTNIGTELLTNPSIILLDEPTSGLDSTAAHSLIDTLRVLADENMTIITSIHQPSSRIFYSFDKLVLLADGHVVYAGPPSKCLPYLKTKNLTPPGEYNPADFVMDCLSTSTGNDEDSSKRIKSMLIEGWHNDQDAQQVETFVSRKGGGSGSIGPGGEEEGQDDAKYQASYMMQFRILLERALIISKDQSMTNMQLFQTVTLALICGLCWWDQAYSEDEIQDRSGYIFFFGTFYFLATLFQGMMQFLPERTILMKERAAGSYRLSAYFISKCLSEMPVRMMMPFIFLSISYPMVNLDPSFTIFLAVCSIQLLAALAGESIGIFIGTVTMDFEKAMVIGTLTALLLMLTGGYFVQNLPSFIRWIRFVSPFKYSYDACLWLGFNREVPCDGGNVLPQCVGQSEVTGRTAAEYLGAEGTVLGNAFGLIGFCLAFRVFAYLSLRFMPVNNGRK